MHDGEQIERETCLGKERGDHRAAGRGVLARLANDGVARHQRRNALAEGESQGIVPGGDDADHAHRRKVEFAGFCFRGRAVMRHAFRPEKFFGVARVVARGVERDKEIGE